MFLLLCTQYDCDYYDTNQKPIDCYIDYYIGIRVKNSNLGTFLNALYFALPNVMFFIVIVTYQCIEQLFSFKML